MSAPITLVYGGTFDPPHRTHARIASQAADAIGAARILVIPAAVNPQRRGTPPAAAAHRLEMARLAFADELRATIDDRETRRPGASYTVDTVQELALERPGERLRLLIGGDQALNFGSWRSPGRIEALAEPVVVPRPPLDASALRAALRERLADAAPAWMARVLEIAPVDASSTQARAMLARGERPDPAMLHPAVTDYALRHGLYRPDAQAS
jgi:nicotinate-nucleotide adenylyltransferase